MNIDIDNLILSMERAKKIQKEEQKKEERIKKLVKKAQRRG